MFKNRQLMRSVLTIEQQIEKLRERGMLFENEKEAKKILLNVSYYRLGFYSSPFETTSPETNNCDRKFKNGTDFDDVFGLYLFDSELRWLLLYFLSVIEVSIKTQITYIVSNYYRQSPIWFVNPNIMSDDYVKDFDSKVYSNEKKNIVLKQYHKKYSNEKYAPPWITLEFMTFGNILNLYCALRDETLQTKIAEQYGCSFDIFSNYLNTIIDLRNKCAHGNCIYDMRLQTCINLQPAKIDPNNCCNISGAVSVVIYMLKQISGNLASELILKLNELLNKGFSEKTIEVIRMCTGLCKCKDEMVH